MSWRRISKLSSLLILLTCALKSLAGEPAMVQRVAHITLANNFKKIVDTRPLQSCVKASLKGAICLPVEDVLAPHRRLANWSGILWALGSAGLSGHEHVLVIGEQAQRREFLAGLLVLAGQHRVSVLEQPVSVALAGNAQSSKGTQRASTRTAVFAVPMRSDLIVLRNELRSLTTGITTILDGRTESEYYGTTIRTSRGGHIPGATHSPLAEWRSDSTTARNTYQTLMPFAYAHDPFETLVYFTALATAGITPRVYLAGWVDWANDGSLPADSASYPQSSYSPAPGRTPSNAMPAVPSAGMYKHRSIIAAALVICLLAASFYGGRKSTRAA